VFGRRRACPAKASTSNLALVFTINDRPNSVDRYYGDDLGDAFQFFLRIRPSLHSHGAAHSDSGHAVAGMQK
jgi:hypothetical protein